MSENRDFVTSGVVRFCDVFKVCWNGTLAWTWLKSFRGDRNIFLRDYNVAHMDFGSASSACTSI